MSDTLSAHLFTGGAISNMYSVMVARYKYFPDVKTKGMSAAPRLVLFTSEHVSTHSSQIGDLSPSGGHTFIFASVNDYINCILFLTIVFWPFWLTGKTFFFFFCRVITQLKRLELYWDLAKKTSFS